MGLGHYNNGRAILELSQKDDTLAVLAWDYDRGFNKTPKMAGGVNVNVNDYIWFELRIESTNVVSVSMCIRTSDTGTRAASFLPRMLLQTRE